MSSHLYPEHLAHVDQGQLSDLKLEKRRFQSNCNVIFSIGFNKISRGPIINIHRVPFDGAAAIIGRFVPINGDRVFCRGQFGWTRKNGRFYAHFKLGDVRRWTWCRILIVRNELETIGETKGEPSCVVVRNEGRISN